MAQYDINFSSEQDFIQCLERGCEIEFLYDGKKFSIFWADRREILGEYGKDSDQTFSSPREALNGLVNDKPLKDVLSEIKIIFRTF